MRPAACESQVASIWGVVTLFVAATVAGRGAACSHAASTTRIAESEAKRAQRFVSGAEAALNRTLIGVDVLLAGIERCCVRPRSPTASLDAPHASAAAAAS